MNIFESKKKYRDIEKVIDDRFRILIVIVSVLFLVLTYTLFGIQVKSNDYYIDQLEKTNSEIIVSSQPPRGVIYDRNHNVIVGNKPIYTIKYDKPSWMGVYDKRELEMAYAIADVIEMSTSKLQKRDIMDAFIRVHPDLAFAKLTDEERNSLLSLDDRHKLIRSRLTDEDLAIFKDEDYEAIAIFTEMNRGYRSQTKIIKNDGVTETEYAIMSEKETEFSGIVTSIDWVRYYPYDELMRGILGRVTTQNQGIPYELKNLYQTLGYDLDSRVGTINSLESEYEFFLNSVESETLRNDSGLYEVLREAKGGNDIVLSLDMELTQRIADAMDEMLIDASKYINSKYMDRAYVMISDPRTGEILAMVSRRLEVIDGKQVLKDNSYGLTTASVLAGSTVKPAFLAAAMDAGVVSPGDKKLDECIKIAATPEKCSWSRTLGTLNDLEALYQSSNSYMFKTVLEWAGGNYVENQAININQETFKILRKYYNEFGLGMETNIDVPKEDLGYKNLNGSLPGFLMDLSIGQYDQYTVAQLSQYINTIANGQYKMQPRLLKDVYSPSNTNPLTESIYDFEPKIDSVINIEQEYIDRVRYGMKFTASKKNQLLRDLIGYMPNPAAKTGTAEGFYDTDGDGNINTEHIFISKAFIAFAPYDNPDMALVVVIPNVSYLDGRAYEYPARETLVQEVTKIYYELYE